MQKISIFDFYGDNSFYPNALVIHKKDLQGKNRMTFAIEGDFDEVK